MSGIPRHTLVDRTPLLLAQGYRFLPSRRRRYGRDVFELRLLGQRVMCMSGAEAAALVYDETRFERRTALPGPVKKTLLGQGGVQTLDDAAHKHRKSMFMSLMTSDSIASLTEHAASGWQAATARWAHAERVVLFNEAREVLLGAACAWAGIPLAEGDVASTAQDLTALVDGFATAGPRHWRARRARAQLERWAAGLIASIRRGQLEVQQGSALQVVAHHRNLDGTRLDQQVAAVELLNLIRPIVAISWYVTFAAHALYQQPEWRPRVVAADGDRALEWFVQEVRRFYPFTPFVGARVRADFSCRGHRFPKGRLVLLDVYGNLHDPDLWEEPNSFLPERFEGREIGAFDFLPQGGGDYSGHRCAGEWITIAQTKAAVSCLSRLTYHVADDSLQIPLHRIPTLPRHGLAMTHVRPG